MLHADRTLPALGAAKPADTGMHCSPAKQEILERLVFKQVLLVRDTRSVTDTFLRPAANLTAARKQTVQRRVPTRT